MNQKNKKTADLSDNELKAKVTENFFKVFNELKSTGHLRNASDLATVIGKNQSRISRMKSESGNYVQLDSIFRLVSAVGVNANLFFLEDSSKEPLLRSTTDNSSKVSGKGNIVQNNHIRDNHGEIHNYNAEKIIKGLSEKDRNEINAYLNALKDQNGSLQERVEDLKKTVNHYEKKLKDIGEQLRQKDQKLQDTQEKLISHLESKVSKSK